MNGIVEAAREWWNRRQGLTTAEQWRYWAKRVEAETGEPVVKRRPVVELSVETMLREGLY